MKKCAVINDLSGFGKCSLGVGIPIISVMGIEAHPLPTAVLSNQTAYDSYKSVPLTDDMPEFISEWKKLNADFDGILTGFVTDERQLDIISSFITEFKTDKTILLVDPIMADNGSLYSGYTGSMCEKIREICFKADIITPNIAELAFLANEKYSENPDDIESYGLKLRSMGMKSIVVTGYKRDKKISNIVFDDSGINIAEANLYGGYYSGTGDILSSIVIGGVLRGMSLFDSVSLAGKFISRVICGMENSSQNTNCNDGIDFEKYLGDLI